MANARVHRRRGLQGTIAVPAFAIVTALAAAGMAAAGRTPPLTDLLHRIAAYVNTYGKETSAFVATETYTQSVGGYRQPGTPGERTTTAEFAIVKTSGSQRWIGFRDVIEVDGKPITDHRDRLLTLLSAPEGNVDEARRLSRESARFNIGPVDRNINVPTTALFFFAPENLNRFKFRIDGSANPDLIRIGFKETATPTLIRTSGGASIPSEGELVVSPDGVVHETILRVREFSSGAPIESTVDVTYARVPEEDAWLPSTMVEEYVTNRFRAAAHIEAKAEYSNYRRFETSVKIK